VEVTIAPQPDPDSVVTSAPMVATRRAVGRSATPVVEDRQLETGNVKISPAFIKGSLRPIPIGGWVKYNAYLEGNRKSFATAGEIILSFSVDAEGKTQAIKIIQGAGGKNNAEAIRLLKDGPGWVQPKNAQERVTVRIEF
jgi:hypothetical protein